jgi:hypothetical protein
MRLALEKEPLGQELRQVVLTNVPVMQDVHWNCEMHCEQGY